MAWQPGARRALTIVGTPSGIVNGDQGEPAMRSHPQILLQLKSPHVLAEAHRAFSWSSAVMLVSTILIHAAPFGDVTAHQWSKPEIPGELDRRRGEEMVLTTPTPF